MKRASTLLLSLCFSFLTYAQWSNTTNQFYDTLHMPVSVTSANQKNAIVLKSYPDSGHFIIWQDLRNAANGIDIYAQKFDKTGKRQWAQNGVPVMEGVDNQTFSPPSNADYRYYNHA